MKIVHFSAGRINPSAAKVGSLNVIYPIVFWFGTTGAIIGMIVVQGIQFLVLKVNS